MPKKKIDLTGHTLVPKHTKLNEKEKKELLEKHNITFEQLPVISKKDAAIRALNVKVGDIIKIDRTSPTSGAYTFYSQLDTFSFVVLLNRHGNPLVFLFRDNLQVLLSSQIEVFHGHWQLRHPLSFERIPSGIHLSHFETLIPGTLCLSHHKADCPPCVDRQPRKYRCSTLIHLPRN